MNAIQHRRTLPLLRAALMGTVALGLLAACGDETDVSEAPAVVEEDTAAVEPASPAAENDQATVADAAPESAPEAAPEADVTVIPPEDGADVVVVEPPEGQAAATSGSSGAPSGSGGSGTAAAAGQPLDPAAFAGEARGAIGTPLRSASGEAIGEVSDVLRGDDETPEALVVSLAENDRMVRVPLERVRVRPGERELLAAGDAEQIRGLPTFEYSGDDNAVVGEDGQGGGASQ
ncbi:hypothetical protein [Azospirillum sp. ST 5-10]|uniref:hypothetical protein n=1 Tax=unclassified Azospirillum TaxID=2630922 RepID=UPI003F4A1456